MTDGVEVVLVDSFEEAQNFMRWLGERRDVLAWDVETTGLDPWRDTIRLCQYGDARTGWAFDYRDWRGLHREVQQRYEGKIVAHNMKFDSSMSEVDGVPVARAQLEDCMPMLHLDDSQGPKGLKPAAALRLGRWAQAGEKELKEGLKKNKWTMATCPIDFEPYWKYGALDTVVTARLFDDLDRRIAPYREAYEREIAVTWILMDMEARGMRVDVPYCEEQGAILERERAEIEARWPGLNLHSSNQVVDALRAEGFRFTKRTDKGAIVVDDEVLSAMDSDLARDVLRARWLRKMANTYLLAFSDLAIGDILHPNIRPLGAEKTGRMSISRPSMQNLPRTALIRNAIIARDGHTLVLADYQAQEMRVLAHFCGDEKMLQAFRDDVDIHSFTAQLLYRAEEVSKKQRFTAKQTGYAKIYGSGLTTFGLTAGISTREAKAVMSRYDALFPRVKWFQGEVVRRIRERAGRNGSHGWVHTLGGHKLDVPVSAAYKGTNYTIQGSCSDMTKDAMIHADRQGVGQFMVLPVHDELIFDVPENEAESAVPAVVECMERYDLRAPIKVEWDLTDRWGNKYADAA